MTYFAIFFVSFAGVITTTDRSLDREEQDEHTLQVNEAKVIVEIRPICDSYIPSWSGDYTSLQQTLPG